MGHSNVRTKIRRRKVANLAARSRQFTVSNNTIPKTKLNQSNYMFYWNKSHLSRFDVDIYGKLFTYDVNKKNEKENFHLIEREFDPTPLLLNNKQPPMFIKCKKRKYSNWKSYAPTEEGKKMLKREKRNDFVKYFKSYPYTLSKMNQQQYMEKLTEHKLAKWERKHPKPMDMFTEEVEKWTQERENMKMHFRDVVISIYDKLKIVGNYVDRENKRVRKKVVATIRDVDGKGHNVNYPNLSVDHKLYTTAVSAAKMAMKINRAILDCDLKNHKGDQSRPLLITKSDLKQAA